MLNFRYHVVTLVALFLALGIGILIGAGALDRPTVEFLQDRIDTVEANADARRQENEVLQADLGRLQSTLDTLEPFAITNRLDGTPVVIVAARGIDPDTMQGLVSLARRGGASAPGILWVEERWSLESDEDRDALADVLGIDATRRSAIRERGWQALVERLNEGPDLASDVLQILTDADFVSFEGVGSDVALEDVGGSGTSVLAVVGTDGTVPARQLLLPAARAAVDAGLPLAGAEVFRAVDGGPDRGALVSVIRDDESLAAEVPTVDDVDLPSGSAVALLSLADLLRGVVGHYGFGAGATASAPEWWQL